MGGGSYGVVLKASRQGRSFAIKAFINDRDEAPADVGLKFRLECEILRRIKHPRIPGYVESFTTAEAHYLVMEHVPGLPLSHLLHTGRRFTEDEVKEILGQLLVILDALHNPRCRQDAVVHRDLRLSNLMLSGDCLYLIDFGLARFLEDRPFPRCPDPLQKKFTGPAGGKDPVPADRTSRQRRIPGADTYRLLRPEISPRSDLFGAGVVAVDLFTNWVQDEALFEQNWEQVLPLSEPFKTWLKKLLSREGFTSAAEALAGLPHVRGRDRGADLLSHLAVTRPRQPGGGD